MTDAADLDREWAMIATVGDPMATAVLAAVGPWDAYRAACDYAAFLDDPNLPHADGLYIAWAELTDVFESGKTDVSVAHAILRAAALAWLDRPRSPSTEWIERWVRSTREAVSAQFHVDGDFWRDPGGRPSTNRPRMVDDDRRVGRVVSRFIDIGASRWKRLFDAL